MKRAFVLAALAMGLALSANAQNDPRAIISKALAADYTWATRQRILQESQAYDPKTRDLVNGIVVAFMAFYESEDLVKPAMAAAEKLQDSGIGTAVYASCKATKGKYALLAYQKSGDPALTAVASAGVVDADALMAKAIAQDPQGIFTHYLRLLVKVEVARLSPFDLTKDSQDDCDFLLAQAPKMADLDPGFRAQVWYYAAEYYALTKKINKSYDFYEKAAREAPKSRTARNAQRRLDELEG